MINQMLEKIADTTASCKQVQEDIFVLDFTIVKSSAIGDPNYKNSGWIVIDLMQHWNVPVYAHKFEMPYLMGERDYPKGDSTVDGGLVA